MNFLLAAWRYRTIVAIATLAAGIAVWEVRLRLARAELEATEARLELTNEDLEEAVRVNAVTAASLDYLRARSAETVAVLAAERDALAARSTKVRIIEREIFNAPQSDDGPLAPVLSRALDGLRRPSAEGGN